MLFWSENLNRENKLGDVLTAAQESNNTGNLFYFEEEKKKPKTLTPVFVFYTISQSIMSSLNLRSEKYRSTIKKMYQNA